MLVPIQASETSHTWALTANIHIYITNAKMTTQPHKPQHNQQKPHNVNTTTMEGLTSNVAVFPLCGFCGCVVTFAFVFFLQCPRVRRLLHSKFSTDSTFPRERYIRDLVWKQSGVMRELTLECLKSAAAWLDLSEPLGLGGRMHQCSFVIFSTKLYPKS